VTASPARWLARRHPLPVEAAAVGLLYALYQTCRGLVAGDPARAVRNAHVLADAERSLHVFVEQDVQHLVRGIPGVVGTLGILYLCLHLAATAGCLLWLHRRRPDAFPVVRTALLAASALALVGYLVFPAAPPRLASLGIADTISGGDVDLNHGLVSALYNPFAAFPSAHVAYAVIVGASLARLGGGRLVRVAGAVYPVLVVLVIVVTGNHFFVDAAAGATVAAAALAAAALVVRAETTVRLPAPAEA
jgi:hypothetical protein